MDTTLPPPPERPIRPLYSYGGVYPRLTAVNAECVDGRPSIAWEMSHPRRNLRFTFDPLHADSSLRWTDLLRGTAVDDATPESATWTGSSLLVVRRGADGEPIVAAARCEELSELL